MKLSFISYEAKSNHEQTNYALGHSTLYMTTIRMSCHNKLSGKDTENERIPNTKWAMTNIPSDKIFRHFKIKLVSSYPCMGVIRQAQW